MGFDSNGTYNRVIPGGWKADALAGIKIRADRHDDEDDGFATGLSTCITKDGRTQPTANIPMNGKRLVNLGEPSSATDAVTRNYVDNIKTFNTGMSIGGADANGRLTFSSPTGVNGLSFTGADLSWLARLAAAPVAGYTNRLVMNSAPDGSGADLFSLNDHGHMNFGTNVTITANVYYDATGTPGWKAVGAGFLTLYHSLSSDGSHRFYSTAASVAANAVGGMNQNLSIDSAGNIVARGNVSGVSGVFSGVCNAAGGGTIGSVTLSGGNCSMPGSLNASGNISAGAQVSGNTVVANGISSNGNITASGSVIGNGNVQALQSSGSPMTMQTGGSGRIIQIANNWYFDWNGGSGELTWRGAGGHWHAFKVDGAFWISGNTGAKSVSGSWASWSDKRIKTVLGDYRMGLDAILKLTPRKFTLNHDPDKKEHVGMVAQEIEKVMPDTITIHKEGEIDGRKFKNLRMFDPTNITYALINAVQELSAKLDAANAKIAALEAK